MPSQKHILTPEQLALSEERKRRKAEKAAKELEAKEAGQQPSSILPRKWLTSPEWNSSNFSSDEQASVMTWNMLAQCLVRRELFPTSDCLKAGQREGMLIEEITQSGSDIICLQEVDRLEKILPALENAGYSHIYACGPRKKHGCVIAYKSKIYTKFAHDTVLYDDENLHQNGPSDRFCRGSSFKTKNIALIVGLLYAQSEQKIVVATTHLFWHPKYTYERARQVYILTRSVHKFRQIHGALDAPSILAGDFNFGPSDAAYSLLLGDPLTEHQIGDIANSRVVHVTIDPTVPIGDPKLMAKEEEDGEVDPEQDPDRVIKNARSATPEDGLLSAGDLAQRFAQSEAIGQLLSVYGQWRSFDEKKTFGCRTNILPGRQGHSEPIYTSFTHYWKVTLDYIFVLLPPDRELKVLGILEPAAPEELGEGLPRKGVCGSDHMSLRALIAWPHSLAKTRQELVTSKDTI